MAKHDLGGKATCETCIKRIRKKRKANEKIKKESRKRNR